MSGSTDNFHASYRPSETGASPFPPRSSKPIQRRGGGEGARAAPNLRHGEEDRLYGGHGKEKEWTSSCLVMLAVIALIGAAVFCAGKYATDA
jgi:hypothetical protein